MTKALLVFKLLSVRQPKRRKAKTTSVGHSAALDQQDLRRVTQNPVQPSKLSAWLTHPTGQVGEAGAGEVHGEGGWEMLGRCLISAKRKDWLLRCHSPAGFLMSHFGPTKPR